MKILTSILAFPFRMIGLAIALPFRIVGYILYNSFQKDGIFGALDRDIRALPRTLLNTPGRAVRTIGSFILFMLILDVLSNPEVAERIINVISTVG